MNKNLTNSLQRVIKNIKFEQEISIVNSNKNEYYNLIEKYGVTNRLNKIIDSFDEKPNDVSQLYKKIDLKIGIICDEFLYYSLKNAADFVYISYSVNIEVDESIDFLLVVSSWRGVDHTWDYVANAKGRVRQALLDLIRRYREKNIKTVFYSKEDPVSYKEYLSIAKESDYIFTSAKEMISEYIKDTGNNNVSYLEFGINPLYHNPIGKDLKNRKLGHLVTFAGSWMVRFPKRNKEALELFNGVHRSGYSLNIIDRQFERKMERYHFPSYLIRYISETIPHERLMRLHKATRWGINLNSVQDSDTMFANRIYELQAMGNVVISNYNKGVHEKFPNVIIENKSKDVETRLRMLSFSEQKRLISEGISKVMLQHTSYHRISKMASFIGFHHEIDTPKVLVIGQSELNDESTTKQTYPNIEYLRDSEFNEHVDVPEDISYIVFMSGEHMYGNRYIESLLSTFAYTNADVVTMNEDNYQYTNSKKYFKTMSMMSRKAYLDLSSKQEDLVYFNIPNTGISKLPEKTVTESYSNVTLVIPINNTNIKFLENKSLLNIHTLNLDIKLVTNSDINDEFTNTLDYLLDKFPNVTHLKVSDHRNIHSVLNEAIDSITTKYLSFLMPGNELSINGYKRVLKFLEQAEYDVVVGKQNILTQDKSNEEYISMNNSEVSIDSIIISKNFIDENNIRFDDRFSRMNSLFLLNIFESDPKLFNLDDCLMKKLSINHQNSKDGIEILKEVYQIEILKYKYYQKIDKVQEYANDVFPNVFMSTYYPLLREADSTQKGQCLDLLIEIYGLYKNDYENSNEQFNLIVENLLV